MKKRCLTILMVLALAVNLAGAAGSNEGVLKVGWPYEPASMDPHRANEDAAYDALRMMVEGLVRNVDGEAVPGIAESWEASADNMEYTFHLRKSRFSDGSPVTAKDFQYSLFRLLDASKAFEKADSAFIIKNAESYYKGKSKAEEVGIEVKNDYTLKLTLAVPTFPITLPTGPSVRCARHSSRPRGPFYGSKPRTCSPTDPSPSKPGCTIRSSFSSRTKLWGLPLHFSLRNRRIHQRGRRYGGRHDAGQATGLVETQQPQPGQTLTDKASRWKHISNYQFLHINHKGKNERQAGSFRNVNFRRALSYAIDRQALVSTVYTTSTPSTRLTAPNEQGVKGRFDEEYPYAGFRLKPTREGKGVPCLRFEELG